MEGVMLKIYAHSKASYGARTRYNAEVSDLTAAFALDFTTSGELMTKRAAGHKLVEIPLTLECIEAARVLWKALHHRDAHTLNIAGNGLSTLALHGWSQGRINAFVYMVVAKVAEHWSITKIVSGGQTGADIAGLVAAVILQIPAIGTLPHGFRQRDADGNDHCNTEVTIRNQIGRGVAALATVPRAGDGHLKTTPLNSGGLAFLPARQGQH
jgi:Circularly permutated YpsA SLOG family